MSWRIPPNNVRRSLYRGLYSYMHAYRPTAIMLQVSHAIKCIYLMNFHRYISFGSERRFVDRAIIPDHILVDPIRRFPLAGL